MSKAAFWQRGEALDYFNDTAKKIEANTIVTIGMRIGVIGTDIAPGATGTVHVSSVFEIAKASEEIAFGDTLYWDSENEWVTKTKGTLTVVAGYATQAAGASAATVTVKLLG